MSTRLPAPNTTISLRKAKSADAYLLWVWANDAESRRASHGREPISWKDHCGWLDARLKDKGTVIFIAESEDSQPVGSIRFESIDQWANARLSYGVAPEARGRGLARAIVSSGCDALRKKHRGVHIVAQTMRENPRSVRVFSSLQWAQQDNGATLTFEHPSPAGAE